MKIYKHSIDKTGYVLDENMRVTTHSIEIEEQVEGKIFQTLHGIFEKINCERFRKGKREVNTIAMSRELYMYLKMLVYQNYALASMTEFDSFVQCQKLFGLNILIRDDFELDEIDVYRDITKEIML